MSDIASLIRQLAGCQGSVIKVCEVTSVDRSARTIDCQPLDESAPILGATLQADGEGKEGITLYPKKGALVIVALVDGTPLGAVILTDEIDELDVKIGDMSVQITKEGILLNEGKLGGLIKVEELTTKINTLEREVNDLKQVLSTWTPVPQDGGSSLKASISSWAGKQIQLSKRGDYEDTKVKH
uniref:Baseplate protein n=1 Tax=virus sp. ct87y24 TaxID=2825805 RepID=A0A8S5Q5J7_9VIRU|nr:MAG TPA: baseplate protein [virus sp. ct87y24]